LTLDQLAATSGVDRGTISRIELGHVSPRIDTISFLCEAMGASLSAFFGPAESATEHPGLPSPAPSVPPAPMAGKPLPPLPGQTEPGGYWPVPASLWHGLTEVLERFEALLKNSSELILVQDPEGLILYASPSAEAILGRRAPDLVGRQLLGFIHPEDLGRFQACMDGLAGTANATASLDYRMRHRDGSWRWLASRFCDQTGNPSIMALVINALAIRE
jgi:PAS domain S-box-containing protein